MTTALKLRRGTTSQHSTFTGGEGEVTVDTTKDTVVVHDGATAGGFPLMKESGSTAGANFATSGGNVGIGISAPAAKLDVFREARVSFNDSNQYRMRLTNTDGNGRILVDGDTSALVFGTSAAGTGATATERMRIDSSGNVGIGTSSPGTKLDVVDGTIRVRSTSGTPRLYFNNGTTQLDIAQTSNDFVFNADTTERMRITYAGNVGIGTSSPSTRLHVSGGNARIDRVGGASSLTLGGAPTDNWESEINFFSSNATRNWRIASNRVVSGALTFTPSTANGGNDYTTPAMTIDSNGNVLIATTSTSLPQAGLILNSPTGLGAAYGRIDFCKTFSGNVTGCSFYHSTSQVGSITYSNTATAYNTASDYRLKENIEPMTGALAKVSALKPVTYKWKADGSASQGFIAHELQAVVPDCVTGEKDAVDAEGKPQYQGIDTSFLVATLTAAIQELKAELDSVKAELAILKGN